MTPQNKISLVSVALAASIGIASGSALALEQGDILVRAGIGYVNPNDESDEVGAGSGNYVGVDSDASLALTLVYMATPNIGVELVGALPFNHEITGEGGLSGAGTIAETDHLPPTLLAQYYFNTSSNIRPYVGAGINYTAFFNTETKGALTGASLDLENSWGLAGEVGVDVDINDSWFFNAAVWYMDIDTEATLNSTTKFDVQIDPWVGFVGIGTKF